jgi:hypothetical protein
MVKLLGIIIKKILFKDRLYEIDKSWKNNLMIYGVPCNENMEEDSIITEEKVRIAFIIIIIMFF